MKVMKINRFIVLLLSFVLMFSGSATYAKNTDIKKEIIFTTDSPEKSNQEFNSIINEKGKKYLLKNVVYETIDSKAATASMEVDKVVETDPIPAGTSYDPPARITEDGTEYKLTSVKKESRILSSGSQISGWTDFTEGMSIGDTKNVNGVICELQGIYPITESVEPNVIDITFTSYDYEVFHWGDIVTGKNTSEPLKGYEQQLLNSVGFSNDYDVLRTYWVGEPYYDSSGVLCRDARADVQRSISTYRASYIGNSDEAIGTVYKLTYTGTKEMKNEDQVINTVKAIATYELVDNTTLYVSIGIGLFLIALLVIMILLLLAKRKKKDNVTEKKEVL